VLPAGYVSVIVCDTRRAEEWRAAFAAEGIEARVEETETEEAHLGACRVGVPRDQMLRANAIITDVTKGRRSLGGTSWLGAAIVVGVAVAIIVLVVTLGS
jgi:hypothetical protein